MLSRQREWARMLSRCRSRCWNQLFNHPLTDKGLEQFLNDWHKAGRSNRQAGEEGLMTHKEITVAKTGELKDGEMKQVSAGGTNILLARVKGNTTPSARTARTTARRSPRACSAASASSAPGTTPASTSRGATWKSRPRSTRCRATTCGSKTGASSCACPRGRRTAGRRRWRNRNRGGRATVRHSRRRRRRLRRGADAARGRLPRPRRDGHARRTLRTTARI